ncbi:MAG: hypothetical protein K8R74_16985 [Bacteroidales bacterium]|nr:hypothetical protein [Bacteroidales bacterium]
MTNLLKLNLIIILLFLSSTLFAQGQEVIAYRQKINEKSLPAIVVETFKKQYHEVFLEGWYETHLVHWQNDLHSNWYDEWYIERTVVIYTYEKPNYYEVEFIYNPGEQSRAIYNIHGYWHETRTQINGLPMAIVEALKETKYKNWKLSIHMEKMESPMWPVAIYRFKVSKGIKSHIIRMDPEGNIIQAKILEG